MQRLAENLLLHSQVEEDVSFFYGEHGGSCFICNVTTYLPIYTELHSRSS
jgi:hypothetical protein